VSAHAHAPRAEPGQGDAGIGLTSRQWTWLVAALLAASTLLKLYHLTAPALDWHSWKQITTLAKARYIYRDGLISFFIPRVDLLTDLDPNSNVGFAEVPILHLLMACGYWLIGGEAEWVGRVWAIAFSLLGGVYLALLVRGRLPGFAAAVAMAIYALSPMNTYFYRTLITDVPMTAMTVMGIYHFVRWMEDGRARDGLWCTVATALAALFKPYALFIGVAYAWVILRREGWRGWFRPARLALGAGAIVPVAAWLIWGYLKIPDRPHNLTASDDLLGRWSELADLDYYSALWARLVDYALTPFVGLAFVAAALGALWGAWRRVRAPRRPGSAPASWWTRPWPDWLVGWWLGAVVYLVVVRRGNHEHDYYQMCLVPALAAGAGLGVHAWWRWIGGLAPPPGPGRRRRAWNWIQWITVGVAAVSVLYAEYRAYGKTTLEMDSWFAGRAVAAVRQDDEKTLYYEAGGLRHQQLLYYTGGKGWLLPEGLASYKDIQPYYEHGARYFVVSMRAYDWERGMYPVPLADMLLKTGHLRELARSSSQVDRYGRIRTWAVYRLVDRPS